MAIEITHRHSATGETLYFTIRNTARLMWSTAGTPNFEIMTVANWGDYDIDMSENPAGGYFYGGSFPSIAGNMVAGWYHVDIFKQAGASPAISDELQASYFGYWDGTTYRWWAGDTTHANAVLIPATGKIPATVAAGDDADAAAIKALVVSGGAGDVEAILSVLAGVASVDNSNPAAPVVTFKKADGTTTKVVITYSSTDGTRTASVRS